MKKKILAIIIVISMLLAMIPNVAMAAVSVTMDKASALPGETVSISGTASADENVVIKITDEAGNIVFFDTVEADADGKYSKAFVVPSEMAPGTLTITAGSGDDVATTMLTIKAAPKPTAKPTSSPAPSSTPEPTVKPTSSPAPSSTPEPTVKPTSSSEPSSTPETTVTPSKSPAPGSTPESTVTPSESPVPGSTEQPAGEQEDTDEDTNITPKEISQDEETGIITVVIEVEDLPEGTVAIETPNGERLYVSDATDGVLLFQLTKDDVDKNGDIEIVALDNELSPLAALRIKVLDENEEIVIAQTGESGSGGWMIVIYIVGALLILAVLAWLFIKQRNKDNKDDNSSTL